MALSDPLVVDYNGSSVNLPLVDVDTGKSVYRLADDSLEAVISHSAGKRKRIAVRFNGQKVAADPLVSGVFVPLSASVTLVIDAPKLGYDVEDLSDLVGLVTDLITRSSGANLTKILGGER